MAAAVVDEELRVVAGEMADFLDKHVADAKDGVLALLDEASHNLRTVSFHDGAATRGPRIFLESEDKMDGRPCVSGSFTLSECHCEDVDLSVRLPKYNKGNQLSFSTGPKTFYLLRQLQDALHLVETASDMVAQLSSFPPPTPASGARHAAATPAPAPAHASPASETPSARAPDWAVLLPSVRAVSAVCDEVASHLRRAETHMADWTPRALPSMVQNWLRMEPPLPPELLLQMYVDRDAVVLRVCVLGMHAPNRCPPNRHIATPGDSAMRLRGRVMSHKGGWIEVLDSVDVRSRVEPLAKARDLIMQAQEMVHQLRLNAQALESCVAQDEATLTRQA